MSEHPQQTDRVLRDTRILTLRIWAVVGCIVIAAVIFNLMGILAPVIEFLAVGSIIASYPEMEQQIRAYAGAANLMSTILGIYVCLFVSLPLANKLYALLTAFRKQKEAA